MSENDPTSPSKQTSSIPLKKETVRVTLKAADAPPAAPSAAIPVRPPTPTAPPTPTGPPIAGGAPRPAPAATIPLKTAPGAPAIPKPAPTIRLSPAPGAPTTPGTAPARPGLPGAATLPAGGSTLPKATVQLTQAASPLGGAIPTSSNFSDDEEDTEESAIPGYLSIVGFIAALVVLFFQLSTANTWVNAEDNAAPGWGNLFN